MHAKIKVKATREGDRKLTSGKHTALIVAAVVIVAALAIWRLVPSDKDQILSVLDDVEDILSISGVEAPIEAVARARKLEPLFAGNARIDLQTPTLGKESMLGRSEIVQTAAGIRSRVSDVQVDFSDVTVTVSPEGNKAQVQLRAKAEYGPDDDLWVQNVRIDFVHDGGGWQIGRAKGVNPPLVK